MTTTRRMRAITFSALMLIQVIAPITYAAPSSSPNIEIETDADLDLFSSIGLAPSGDIAHGWFDADDGAGSIHLLYRDAGVVAVEDWNAWTGQSNKLSGWFVLTHQVPIPTEWFYELADAGIDCHTYVPPNGFQCQLNGHSTDDLYNLDVQGLVQIDGVDKVREDLVRGITGQEKQFENPYSVEGKAIVNIVLSGNELPEGMLTRSDIIFDSHSNRFVTVIAETSAIAWMAMQESIEWIETKPYFRVNNDVAATIIHTDDVQNTTMMNGAKAGWSGVDGTGIVVTVGDTGLDNGVNNTNMHPDFRDHIKGIYSFPLPPSACTWTAPNNPGPCDDTAEDDHGHGTHVAGSVLGDGSIWPNVQGMAPEAQLLVHSLEYNGGLGGIPNDLGDMFDMAVSNGSRVHTNSWGSSVAGYYTTSSMQSDLSALEHDHLVIMYAAANEGEDADSDGEIDLDSMGAPATAKNVISIGASENLRSNATGSWPVSASNNISGMAVFSSRGPTDDGRLKPDFSAPGTNILSTRSRSSSSGSGDYTYMSGTSMATPVAAGGTAQLLEHLIQNINHPNPSSALVKGIFAATAVDMMGQYNDVTNGAGETAPNNHEGWGRINLWDAKNSSFVDRESLSTGEERGWSITVPSNAPKLKVMLSYNDAVSSPTVSANLINDVDLAIKNPSGVWTNLSDNVNNLKGLTFNSPAQGVWEVHILGTNVPSGPQFFSVAVSADYELVNLTKDADFDGTLDEDDQCAFTFGTSSIDRKGCVDTDGDGYSDPTFNWTIAQGADMFINDATQWFDQDGDGYGDNAGGNNPDACPSVVGTSTGDRYGCVDSDMDSYSDAETNLGGWTIAQGADACRTVPGTSNGDRNGCPDEDGDGYSDPDPSGTNGSVWLVANGADAFLGDSSQWNDTDSDGYGDNPPPATSGDDCINNAGTSTIDRLGCPDTDGDGYSNADATALAHPAGTADAFPNDNTQWLDTDGDGYGDNQTGNNPDACVNDGLTAAAPRSSIDRLGCPDSDGDGYSDYDANWPAHPVGSADAFPLIATQWNDTDADGYGDESTGYNPDMCVTTNGNSSQDRHGCPDTDGDGYSDPDPLGNNGSVWTVSDGADVWPNEPTQWADSDTDGYGDNPAGVFPDHCPSIDGNSTSDRYGCTDTDGDTYSDPDAGFTTANGADTHINDPLRWSDEDGDGFDNQIDDDCPLYWGDSTVDRKGCPDTDGDGVSDSDPGWTPTDNGSDAFKTDPTQSTDADGDGFGDNASGNLADDCPNETGDSWQNNVLGCLDTDQDGWANIIDSHVNDPSQWSDSDTDGFGDNIGGNNPDACPNQAGNSTNGGRMGCLDTDGDGWDDVLDQLPNLAYQWLDQDGDGFGDNASGPQPDACPGVAGNSTIDRFGCVDDDGDGMSNESDAFPNDPTRTQDSDGDGFDDLEDDCMYLAGNSTADRKACPDTDGDGYSDPTLPLNGQPGWNASDGADALPLEPTQWADQDGDGYGDNQSGFQPDSCPTVEGYSNIDIFGCYDEDNDGSSQTGDAFPDDPTQWSDIDGDGFGDNPNGTQPDNCTTQIGTSTLDVFGCPDEDGDGASDTNDLWLNDSSQWFDSDGDGFGDNVAGTDGDACPQEFGLSSLGNNIGCVDSDADKYADNEDDFPDETTQWVDVDGDGYGDNNSAGAIRPDHWPDDPARNAAEGHITCTPDEIELDLAAEDYFSFSCTVVSVLSGVTIRAEWQPISSIISSSQVQTYTFTETTGDTQIALFNGEGRAEGEYQLFVTIKEPGADIAMDSDSVVLKVFDSRIVDDSELVTDESSAFNEVMEMPIVQAMIGALVLFSLMGMLMIRGNAAKARLAEERTERAREVLTARMNRINQPPAIREGFGVDGEVPPPPPPRPPTP
ncbi:MAG: hypothetical protein CMA09_02885 [Euryarchaeota archaeon]|nr:hypothetical protein [Euryarchaeota archaeon]